MAKPSQKPAALHESLHSTRIQKEQAIIAKPDFSREIPDFPPNFFLV
jgi:hypothetical protein